MQYIESSTIEKLYTFNVKPEVLEKFGLTVLRSAHIYSPRLYFLFRYIALLDLDPKQHSEEAIKAFKEKYEAEELVPFRLFLEEEGLQSRAIK